MAAGVLVVSLFSCSLAFALMGMPEPPNKHVPGEVIVGFYPQATLTQINDAVSSIGGKIIAKHNAPKARITRIKLPAIGLSLDEVIANLKSNPAFANVIMYVEPNVIRQAMQVREPGGDVGILSQSGDPLLMNQWGYYDIGANRIPAPTTTSGVTVAVIDTGVDYTHPDLVGKVTKGYDYVNADTDPMDDFGHGTHVSGIIAAKANNNYGIAGVSWNAKIYAVKVLDSTGFGNVFDIALAIIAAANNSSVKVINMSLGGGYSSTEELAVDYAVDTKGKLLVAAAGNNNSSTRIYPAGFSTAYPGRVLAVAAHDITDCRASFSNYGTWVSITAPGVDILSTLPPYMNTANSGFESWSGTSMATPHVAAVAALAWEKYPTYTNVQIANLITTLSNTAVPLNRNGACWPNDGSTFQRVNVFHILEQQYFELCNNKGSIYGFAFDAETGLPLAGARVTAKEGTTTTGIDYVPYFGERTFIGGQVAQTGYGLFSVSTLPGDNTLTIQKTKYMTFSPKDQNGLPVTTPVTPCNWSAAGNIPVPPAKPYYWLAVTWNQGYTGARYDLFADVYQSGYIDTYSYYYGNPGNLNVFPYVKVLWDSDTGKGDSRDFMETIRVSKTIPNGEYLFYVYDWWNGPGSTNWGASGMKAYLYKGNKLIKTYTPPAGAGGVWLICDITGSTIHDLNFLQ